MQSYKIKSVDKKTTKTGKPYAIVLLDDKGTEVKASMWEGYESLMAGVEVQGEVYKSGDFTNFRLGTLQRFAGTGGAAPRAAAIKEAQVAKETGIRKAQDNSQLSIKISGAMRDATLITLASLREQPFPTDEEFKQEWRKWRDWIINEFDQERAARE